MIIAIQARSDSKRFPRKIFKKFNKKTVLENIIDNLKSLDLKICVCSTKRKIDSKIKTIAKKKNCFFLVVVKIMYLGDFMSVRKNMMLIV